MQELIDAWVAARKTGDVDAAAEAHGKVIEALTAGPWREMPQWMRKIADIHAGETP